MSPSSPLVLMFDRDVRTRAWYRTAFASTEYRFAEATSGEEAVALLTRQLPDLIITELRTQRRDGLILCVIKHSNPATANIPFLMVVLNGDSAASTAAQVVGVSELLQKPPAASAVVNAARRMIQATPGNHMTQRRLYRTLADLRNEVTAHTSQSGTSPDSPGSQLLTLMASALSGVVLTNDEAKCVAVNSAACGLTGYTEAELLTRSVLDLTPPDTVDHARMLWTRFLVNGECSGEFLLVQKNGEEVVVQLCAVTNIVPGLHATVSDRALVDN